MSSASSAGRLLSLAQAFTGRSITRLRDSTVKFRHLQSSQRRRSASSGAPANLTNKRLVLLYNSKVQPWNSDLDAITAMLYTLTAKGAKFELLDTSETTEQELAHWRDKAMASAVYHHLRIRQPFGSRRQGGLPYFGKQVPALLVFEEGQEIPLAVFPHRERRDRAHKDLSIEYILEEFFRG